MPHPNPYPPCIFCGDRANSREHAVPAWISRRLGIRDFLSTQGAVIHNVMPRKQPISFASHRARIFCSSCNTHFKHLEDAVIPLIVPLARRGVVSLGSDHQHLLAVWAAKTALALLPTTAPELREVVPLDHRRSIRMDGRPPPEMWIGFFEWIGDPLIAGGIGVAEASPEITHDMYLSVLAFAGIGFVVSGFRDPLGPNDRLDGDKPSLVRFWPPRAGLIHWPPLGPALRPGDDVATLLNTAPLRRRFAA